MGHEKLENIIKRHNFAIKKLKQICVNNEVTGKIEVEEILPLLSDLLPLYPRFFKSSSNKISLS